jgi:LacI family transcriptional regulator
MPVTIMDVARAAGVSASTVSRALANPDLVRAGTRERVRQAVAALGYHPNRAARGLITGRTGNLGLIVPDLSNPFFAGVAKGIQTRAREQDYAVFVADTDEDPAAEAQVAVALGRQVDGLILSSARTSDSELRAIGTRSRLVLLNRRVAGVPAVTVANADGMRQAVAHLAALGHRTIAFVAGPATSWSNAERAAGLREAARQSGVELLQTGHFAPRFEGGVAAADLVAASGATAVIAYNDIVALGLLSRLAARGIRVPEEISVIGCDDIPMSAMTHPALTTISLPKEQAGRAGVDLLLSLLSKNENATESGTSESGTSDFSTSDTSRNDPEGSHSTGAEPSSSPHRELPTHLIVRGTTGVAAPHA